MEGRKRWLKESSIMIFSIIFSYIFKLISTGEIIFTIFFFKKLSPPWYREIISTSYKGGADKSAAYSSSQVMVKFGGEW